MDRLALGLARGMEDDHVPDAQVTDGDPLGDDDVAGLETRAHAAGEDRRGMPAARACLNAAPGEGAHGEHEQQTTDRAAEALMIRRRVGRGTASC
jgi:hypothetical protein